MLGPTEHPRAAEGGHYDTGPAGAIPLLPNEIADQLTDAPDPETYRTLTPGELDDNAKRILATYADDRESYALDPITDNFDPTPGGRHASIWETLCWALREGKPGRFPGQRAVDALRELWAEAIGNDYRDGDPDEFNRMVRDAVHVADNDGTVRELWERAHRDQAINEDDFWSSSARLRDLRQFARARRVGPWAMLGNTLARVVAAIPSNVVLPPEVGDYASLNLFVALVGRSGESKSASMKASAAWLAVEPDYPPAKPGSGEGLAKCFAYVLKPQGQPPRQVGKQWSVLAQIPEVDTLTAAGGRGGATIMSELRSAWSGERIGFDYAGADKRIMLREHRYRLCLTLGVQPLRAQPLFDDADGGTPQRFVWFPVRDADVPKVRPDEPPLLDLRRWPDPSVAYGVVDPDLARASQLAELSDPSEYRVIEIPKAARRAIDRHQFAVLSGSSRVNPLDGHQLLCRLKVAAALMALEGRRDRITDADWKRAGTVMLVSDRTRRSVLGELSAKALDTNVSRGRAEGIRAEVAEQKRADRAIERIAHNIVRKLKAAGGDAARSDVRGELNSRDRSFFDDAERLAIESKRIEKVPSNNNGPDGHVLRLLGQGASK